MGSQLRYQEGASKWLEGQMVYGRVQLEQISLNEESFWAGYPRDNHRPEAYEYLGQVRQYINQGEYVKAQTLAEHKMLSRFNQPYQPLGTLNLAFPEAEEITDYERVLDMDRGIVTVKYKTERSKYTREYFSNYR